MLGGVLFGAGGVDRFGERGEFLRVAGVEVGIVEGFFVAGDRGFDFGDPLGEQVEVALVLVAELGLSDLSLVPSDVEGRSPEQAEEGMAEMSKRFADEGGEIYVSSS